MVGKTLQEAFANEPMAKTLPWVSCPVQVQTYVDSGRKRVMAVGPAELLNNWLAVSADDSGFLGTLSLANEVEIQNNHVE